ncbi:branched-chain-amino-acid transaminase [bacterium]|nr:branched-chain-amino-acid transaminase [bacterium]
MAERLIYIDGEYFPKEKASVSVFDHGLLYGDGVFEGIRAYNGKIFKLEEHVERLYFSAKCLMLDIGVSAQEMSNLIVESVRRNELHDAYIRVVVTRGKGDLGIDPRSCPKATIIIIVDTIKLYPQEFYDNGLEVITSSNRRNSVEALNPKIKSLNYLNNIMAKMEGTRAGLHEVIMLNENNYVAECSADNIFIVDKGILKTPYIHLGALEGITRNTIMQIAKESGLKVEESTFTRFDIYGAEEVFLTGTAAEAVPVIKVDGRIVSDGKPGPIFKDLRDKYKEYINSNGTSIYT